MKYQVTHPHIQAKRQGRQSPVHTKTNGELESDLQGVSPKVKTLVLELVAYVRSLEQRIAYLEAKDDSSA